MPSSSSLRSATSPRGRGKGAAALSVDGAFTVRGVGDDAPYEVFTGSQCVGAGVLDGPFVIRAAGHMGPALQYSIGDRL